MGTPNFTGVIAILLGASSLIIWSALVFLSLLRIANKKDSGKAFNLPWVGGIEAQRLLAICLSCPFLSACVVIFGMGFDGVSNLILLTIILSAFLFPIYIALFLLYCLYRLIASKFVPGKKQSALRRFSR